MTLHSDNERGHSCPKSVWSASASAAGEFTTLCYASLRSTVTCMTLLKYPDTSFLVRLGVHELGDDRIQAHLPTVGDRGHKKCYLSGLL